MAKTFRIFNSQGQSVEVQADSFEDAFSIVRRDNPANAEAGVVIRDVEAGSEQYISTSRSMTDPERVARLRGGMAPREEARLAMSEEIIQREPIRARAASAVQALPFVGEYADELAGAMYGPRAMEDMRRAAEAMQQARPTEAMLTQLGTGIVGGLPLGVAALPSRAQGLGASMLRYGIGGGVASGLEGLISGYGAGEDPAARSQTAQQRGATNVLFGVPLGAAGPLVGAGVGKVAGELFGQAPMRRLSSELELTPEAARVAAAAREFELGGEVAQPNVPASLAETSGEMRGLLDVSVSVPSAGRAEAMDIVNRQAREASEGLTSTLNDTLGEPMDVRLATRELMRDTAERREQLYANAYNTRYSMDDPNAQRLAELVDRVDDSVLREANRIMAREGLRSQQMRLVSDADGNIVDIEEMPDIRQIDYITRALQSRAGTLGASPEDVRTFSTLLRDIRETADELAPAYREARSEAARVIGEREAMKFGEQVLSPTLKRGDVQIGLENMTEGELENVRSGMRQYIDDVTARVSRPLSQDSQEAAEAVRALRALTSREGEDKIRLVLGDEQASSFIERLRNAVEPLAVRAVGAGSPTAPRTFAERVIREEAEPGMIDRLAGGQTGLQQEAAGLLAAGSEASGQRMSEITGQIAPFVARQRSPESLARLRELLGQVPAARDLPENMLRSGIRGGSVAGIAAGPTAARAAQEFDLAPRDVRRMR
jgi:hypothetical protein